MRVFEKNQVSDDWKEEKDLVIRKTGKVLKKI